MTKVIWLIHALTVLCHAYLAADHTIRMQFAADPAFPLDTDNRISYETDFTRLPDWRFECALGLTELFTLPAVGFELPLLALGVKYDFIRTKYHRLSTGLRGGIGLGDRRFDLPLGAQVNYFFQNVSRENFIRHAWFRYFSTMPRFQLAHSVMHFGKTHNDAIKLQNSVIRLGNEFFGAVFEHAAFGRNVSHGLGFGVDILFRSKLRNFPKHLRYNATTVSSIRESSWLFQFEWFYGFSIYQMLDLRVGATNGFVPSELSRALLFGGTVYSSFLCDLSVHW